MSLPTDLPTEPAATTAGDPAHPARVVPPARRGSPSARSLAGLPLADPGMPDLSSGDAMLRWLARAQAPLLARGVVWGVLWMGAQAAIPAALGAGIQAVADRDETAVLRWSGVVLLLGIAQAVAGVLRHRMAVANWIAASSRVQQVVARRAAELGGDLPRQVATGEVVAVTANDVERIGSAFDVIARFAGAVVSFVGVAIVLLLASPLLGTIVLIGLPLLSGAVFPLLRPLERLESRQREKYGKAAELASDTVSGLRVLRGIGGEELFVRRYKTASQDVRAAAIETNRVRSLLDALQVALPGVFVVVVTFLGAELAIAGTLEVGQLVAFYGYTAFLVLPLRTLTETADKATRARVAAGRIVRVLTVGRAHDAATGGVAVPPRGPLVDPDSGVVIAPGTLTAVVVGDPDAAGRLADRLGGVGSSIGGVTYAGVPLDSLRDDDVRRLVLVQDKDPVILSGTLQSLLGVPGSGRVEVRAAVEAACADDIVDGLGGDPEAYGYELPERGRTLSGGQRQRLALARSLVADPDVLVLDDPTSAVDAHTELSIASRLRVVRAGRTTVVFTTSPLVLEQCDRVVFVPDGEVAAQGRHRELMRDAAYRAVVAREEEP